MNSEISIELFSRPDCHLCDDALGVIEGLLNRYPLTLRVTNVENDPKLEEEYGARLPLVSVSIVGSDSGPTFFEYPLQATALEKEFKRLWKRSTS